MPTYDSLLSQKNYQGNIVIRLNQTGPFYTLHPVDSDSGGLLTSTKNGYIQNLTQDPQQLDIQNAQTTFGTVTFSLIDKNNDITSLFKNNKTIFTSYKVEVWLGRVGVSMDFLDYLKLPDTKVDSLDFQDELFTFGAVEISAFFKRTIFSKSDILASNVAIGAGTVTAKNDISNFPASGTIQIDNEFLAYSSKAGLVFTLTGTATETHSLGVQIYNTVIIAATNPIDLFLQICISNGGGGTYDVLSDGLGINPAFFDITDILQIKADSFPTDVLTFKMSNIKDAFDFLTQEIFLPNNLRLTYSENSLLTLVLLDKVVFGQSVTKFDKTNIIPGSVTYSLNDHNVRNVIQFNYDYNYSTQKYESVLESRDTISIGLYGEREPFIINSKGITTVNDGFAIATDRNTKWLGRLKSVVPTINLSTQTIVHLARNGERIQLDYDLPYLTGNRKFNTELEVLQRGFDPMAGQATFQVGFTGYSGLREGFISPSDPVTPIGIGTVNSFTVPTGRGSKYKVGWKMQICDITGLAVIPPVVNTFTIISIVGDTITASANFTFAAGYIRFADYDIVIADQQRYAFVSNGSSDFADSSPPYQITY